MTHCTRPYLMLKLLFISAVLGLSSGCTSALKALPAPTPTTRSLTTKSPITMEPDGVCAITPGYWNKQTPILSKPSAANMGRTRQRYTSGIFRFSTRNPATYKRLSNGYSKDATQVFYGRTRLEGADLATFERLGDGWSRDVDDVYSGNRRLDVCDIDTFEYLSMWRAVDSKCYYIQAERLTDVDRASLEILWGVYAKDRSRVYWLDHIVDGASPETFEVKDDRMQSLARDANQCFIGPDAVTCDELNPEGQEYCRC